MRFLITRLASVDHQINDFLAASKAPWLKKIFEILTHLGDGWIWISVYLVSLIFFKECFYGIISPIITAEIAGLLMVVPLRYAIKRKRPDKSYKSSFGTPWNKYSFPSHHSLRSFIIAVAGGIQYPALLVPLLVMAVIIGFSRMYLAKHYLSDVLAGALMGTMLATVSVILLS